MGNKTFSFGTEFSLSRRDLLKYSIISAGVPAFAVAADVAIERAQGGGSEGDWPEFLIKRESDEVFLKMRAVGFRLKRGAQKLQPLRWTSDHFLEFTLPPQHYAESTIGATQIPDQFREADLQAISLTPSRPSTLVFRVPDKAIGLRSEELLDWSRFELLMPDAAKAGELYDLEIPRLEGEAVSRIEMPWGIELSPVPGGPPLGLSSSVRPRIGGGWTELWSAALQAQSPDARLEPLKMEVFSVRGFRRVGQSGSTEAGTLVIRYSQDLGAPLPPAFTPLETVDRVEIAASLSPRFPYTGKVRPRLPSAQLLYDPSQGAVSAAHQLQQTIAVDQFRLSSRGGTIDLLARFKPPPGSGLSSWTHAATLGRDTFVRVIREGFLFPFGTPCQLIIVSQRVFGKDEGGHFTAPLIKQAFLRVHQPNRLEIEHGESPFQSITITTEQSPPLDLPASGNPGEYGLYDFFLPMVKGAPFAFDHEGTDWAGEKHRASMAHIFVSNRTTMGNGLIWEPGYDPLPPAPPSPVPFPKNSIPKTGEGLRVVDRVWTTIPGRFADYGGSVSNLARASARGSTAQKLDWVEWVRGNVADLDPTEVVHPPFRPRARTMRIQAQAAEHLSGEKSALLATYRDTRFTSQPFLDPEPTTSPPADYFANVTAALDDPETPYLYFLESRPLVGEQRAPAPRGVQQAAAELRDLYYRTSGGTAAVPAALFNEITNEIGFGRQQSADGIGGLSVPDTHASLATRRLGIVGDASFNERRWPGMTNAKPKLERANRLDFAAFAKSGRPPYDLTPFDASRTPADRARTAAQARALMGYAPAAALLAKPTSTSPFAPGLKLGDLFGADAEFIPGLRFSDIFKEIGLAGSDDEALPLIAGDPGSRPGRPLAWDVKLLGIDWLRDIQEGRGPPLASVLADLINQPPAGRPGAPASLGLEATLDWSNTAFKPVTVGPATFVPSGETRIDIEAAARIDLGAPRIEGNPPQLRFTPGKPRIKAATKVVSFAVEIFGAIRIHFESVSFTVEEDGSKAFATKLKTVELLPPLDFINQLQSMLGGLGGDSGMKIDISPERAMISQTLAFPVGGGPLLIGPAQVTNLALFWAVTIPLMGRDVLSVAFGISSREKPLTVFVPPWYGGKAYALIEATTRGCRLVEISMEYGALIPINWGPARGEASLTAGIFYQLRRLDGSDSGSVTLTGFVKAASNLSVAGIIHFTGLIYIALTYDQSSGGEVVIGTSLIKVSVKIGFVRYSYSFTAKHVQRRKSGGSDGLRAASDEIDSLPTLRKGRGGDRPERAVAPYGGGFSSDARAARDRLLAGYRTGGRGR